MEEQNPKRSAIPAEVVREILVESGHRCAVCGEGCPLERAHIIPWRKVKEHKAENLICLCANCHQRADLEGWGEKALLQYKRNPWIKTRTRQDFEKNADLRVMLFLQEDCENFIFLLPFVKDHIYEVPLQFQIGNFGKMSAKAPEIFYNISRELNYRGDQHAIKSSGIKGEKLFNVDSNEYTMTSAVKLESLHPKQGFRLTIPISVPGSTVRNLEIPVRTKDKVDVLLHTQVTIALILTMQITHEHGDPTVNSFKLIFLDTHVPDQHKILSTYEEQSLKYALLKAEASDLTKETDKPVYKVPLEALQIST